MQFICTNLASMETRMMRVSDDRCEPDIEALFTELDGRLRAIVAHNIAASAGVIEEACQAAWVALTACDGAIPRERTLGWLATTGTREALRLVRSEAECDSLDALGQDATVLTLPSRAPSPPRALELRDRLAVVHRLPVRQQRMVWLQGFGFDYNEIAARTGDSRRTVERQLMRARRALRYADAPEDA